MDDCPLYFFLLAYLSGHIDIRACILILGLHLAFLRLEKAMEGCRSPSLVSFPLHLMPLKRTAKKTLISKHRTHDKDTGSPQVQIAILTKEVDMITKHLQEHKKDHSARRGLLAKVARRRKLLNYLRMNKPEHYQSTIEKLKLKK